MPHGRTTAARRKRRPDDAPLVVYGANAVRELLASELPVARGSLERGPRVEPLGRLAAARGIPVEIVERPVLDRLAGSPQHQGAVAVAAAFRYAPLEVVLGTGCASALVLDGVQDPRNL